MTITEAGAALADEQLRGAMRGRLIGPQDREYDEARAVYNAMIDRRPALVAACEDVADVVAVVDFARRSGMLLAVRGGGHNAGGLGVADDAVVCDLSAMHGVRVDPDTRRVRVEGGATLGQLDHATHPFGLAVPGGIVGTTGVSGLTLGGGLGYLARRFGLSIDRLRAADVVLADGSLVRASETEHPDLFWALRSGGGNFGVVTWLEFEAAPVGDVTAGPTLYPMAAAPEVMRWWDDLMRDGPEELYGFFAFLTVPPADPFPAELHMRKMCGIVWCHTGTPEEAEADLAEVRRFGPPALDGVARIPFPAMQAAFDPLYPPGFQWYWKADHVDELSDAAIAAHVDHGERLPSMHSGMHLYPIDGAVHRVPPDATAWPSRGARYAQVIAGVDPDPANADALRTWAREYWEAVHPYAAGGAYVNFLMPDDGAARIREVYGGNYDRLREVKRRYDPQNLFRVNHNIAP
jgi:FAD/FMN-containing dehydrogenase